MTKLEQLAKKIQGLVPEIMGIKKGCKILHKNTGVIDEVVLKFELDPIIISIRPSGSPELTMCDGWMNSELTEILGRDIQLADVLQAIARSNRNLLIDSVGDFYEEVTYGEIKLLGVNFDLTKPLHQQSPETISFLYDILI